MLERITASLPSLAPAEQRVARLVLANPRAFASLPVAELQTITKTLANYQDIAQRANDEAERARVSYDAGTVSATQYGQALLAAAQANAELAAATQAQAAETKDAVDQSNRLANEREGDAKAAVKAAQASGAYADALQASGDAASEVIRAEIELARTKGDTVTATAKLQQLAKQEAATAQAVAAAKEAEAQQTQLAYEKQQAYLAAVGGGSEIQKQELELLRLKAVALGEEAKAAAIAAEIKKQAEQQHSSNTKATQENTRATNENSEAQQVNIKHTNGAAAAGKLLNDYLQAARQSTEELSEATRNLFDAELYKAAYNAGFEAYEGYRKAIVAYKDGVNAGKTALTTSQTELDNANTLIEQSELKILSATSAWQRMDAVIELATGKAKKSFYEQAIAAENLAQGLDRAMESTAGFLQQTIDHAEKASQGLHLLDDQDLSRLRAAIDAANDKLREMQEETQSAKDRLQELNAELAEARGEDQKAKELRQQLEFQTDLAAIEDQRRKAELTGNTEALRALDEQKKVLEAINKIRIDNIRSPDIAEKQRRYYEDAQRAPERTGGGLATNTFNINVDGRDLLSEDQIRNKIIPVLNRATRLSK